MKLNSDLNQNMSVRLLLLEEHYCLLYCKQALNIDQSLRSCRREEENTALDKNISRLDSSATPFTQFNKRHCQNSPVNFPLGPSVW